jgi:hypothetical protein
MTSVNSLGGAAGAKQMLWYQWLPTTSTAMQAQNAVQVQGNARQVPDYGGRMRQVPGAFSLMQPAARAVVTQGGPWDTSIADTAGNLNPLFAAALRARPRRPHR